MKNIKGNKLFLILGVFFVLIGAVGYLIGAGFVDYALKRNGTSAPAAAEKIVDPNHFAPEKPNAKNEEWTITSDDGLKLVATHFSPKEETSRWVILVHGYGRNQSFVWDYADEYIKRGYNVLTPDLRAAGKSEGEYLTMCVKESNDIVLWANEIVQRDANAKIALHGISMGAATVITAGAKHPKNVAAVIEDCGYTSAYIMFTAQLKKLFGLPEFPIMNSVDIVSKIKTGVKVSDAAPIEVIDRVDVPTLFIHGDADKLAPVVMLEQLYDASKAPVKKKMLAPGAGHADSKDIDPKKYYDCVFGFLKDNSF